MARKVVGSMSEWSGMFADMHRQIGDGSLTLEQMVEMVSYHRNPFRDLASRIEAQVERQRIIYKNAFSRSVLDGFDLDFDKIQVLGFTPEFNRVLVVAGGFISNNLAFEACSRRFACWRWTENLDEAVVYNDRNADKGGYAILFRDRQEADEELKSFSADRLKEMRILGPTLLERQWYELVYCDETGEHLDVSNVTLCAGSRDAHGCVPTVYWHSDLLEVDWSRSDYGDEDVRSRAAVPCPPKAD
jgi:hypothetical protein